MAAREPDDSDPGVNPENDDRIFFSLAEANRLLPELTRAFALVLQSIQRVREITAHLSSLGGANPGALRSELQQLYGQMRAQLEHVQKLGCVVKDVQKGLVDFWHRRGGEEVFLCWRYPEEAIEWFHDPSEGFSGRKPLKSDDDDLAGPSSTSSLH